MKSISLSCLSHKEPVFNKMDLGIEAVIELLKILFIYFLFLILVFSWEAEGRKTAPEQLES